MLVLFATIGYDMIQILKRHHFVVYNSRPDTNAIDKRKSAIHSEIVLRD